MRRFKTYTCVRRFMCLAILFVVFVTAILSNFSEPESQDFNLNFIPRFYNSCEQLFANTSVAKFFLTVSYRRRRDAFNDAVQKATVGLPIEGSSKQMREQYLALHYLAGQPAARTACETGFNMGHSSFNYLTANDQITVHSFDLGQHPYVYGMAEYLRHSFPSRFFVHFGNSTETLPQFIRNNPGLKCDLMFVDGGHVFSVALADLRNFARLANLESNVVVLDDFPTDWGQQLGKAWERMTTEGYIEELMRCRFTNSKGVRGFVIGRFLRTYESVRLPGKTEVDS